MERLIEDYKNELRHMRANAPRTPWLMAAAAVLAALGIMCGGM